MYALLILLDFPDSSLLPLYFFCDFAEREFDSLTYGVSSGFRLQVPICGDTRDCL